MATIAIDLSGATWRKASLTQTHNDQCVEVALITTGARAGRSCHAHRFEAGI